MTVFVLIEAIPSEEAAYLDQMIIRGIYGVEADAKRALNAITISFEITPYGPFYETEQGWASIETYPVQ